MERVKETDKIFNNITSFDAKLMGEELNKKILDNKVISLNNSLKDEGIDKDKIKEELVKTQDEIEQIELRVRDYKDQKETEQLKYVDYFMMHYLTEEERKLDNDELIQVLERKVKHYLLSKYVYEILLDLIKLRATE